MTRIRVLIADDHALVRAGLRALLSAEPHLEIVGEAADGVVVVEECRRLAPDIVLLDLTMPGRGGIGAIQDLRQACPQTKVLVLTMHEDEAYARQAFLAGASGYVLKRALATELLSAIQGIQRGEKYVDPSFGEAVALPARAAAAAARNQPLVEVLTPREREVISLVALGHTNAEVGRRLHISEKTVETHRLHIITKLALRSRADLVRFALEHQLMGP
jgi:two-component system, NarL family, response regulator NreC